LSDRGPENLSDLELLEQLLILAVPDASVKKIAFTLRARFGSYAKAICAPRAELETVEGLGEGGIFALKLVQATMIKTLRAEIIFRPVLSNWAALMEYLTALLAHEPTEKFVCLFLDTKNRLIAEETIAEGSVNRLHFYPREIIQRALAWKATAIILVHNHPSGDPSPSQDDIVTTKRLKLVGDHLGIEVHDHVIIGLTEQYSFAAEGGLKRFRVDVSEELSS